MESSNIVHYMEVDSTYMGVADMDIDDDLDEYDGREDGEDN